MTPKTICVLGGTGFVGHQLISQLTKAGYYVVAPSRNRERHRSLSVLPKVDVVDADIHDEEALKALFVGCHAVINLVGIPNNSVAFTGEIKGDCASSLAIAAKNPALT